MSISSEISRISTNIAAAYDAASAKGAVMPTSKNSANLASTISTIEAASAQTIPLYTNQIPVSTDTDGSTYNGTGYKSGYRLSSGGVLQSASGSYVTGFIPCKVGDVIHMKNVTFQYGITSGLTSNNQRVSFFDSSKSHLTQTNATGLGGVCGGVKNDDGIWTEFTVKQTMNSVDCSNVAYFRISGSYIGADSIITVSEAIIDMNLMYSALMWENSSPTSAFSAQTVALNLSAVDGIEIYFKNKNNSTVFLSTGFIPMGKTFTMFYITSDGSSQRRAGSVSTTGISFETGYAASTASTACAIPIAIYAYKGIT